MLNLYYKYAKKRRYIIVNEEDIMTVLQVTDKIKRSVSIITMNMDMEIGNCGWKLEPEKWYIFFNMTHDQWCDFISNMEKKGYKLINTKNNDLYLVKD